MNRDKAILDDLRRFRVLDRDQLIKIHFNDQKHPITTCNRVMNRLVLKGLVKVSQSYRPYKYFHGESNIKTDSMKLPHFSAIADTYIDMCKYAIPDVFEVEVKPTESKGGIEPDAFCMWNGALFFIEIQRSVYTKKVWSEKIMRYRAFYESGEWKQMYDVFPIILVFTDHIYEVESGKLTINQAKDFDDMVKKYMTA